MAQKKTAPVESTPPPIREEFTFGKIDLEVLEQSDLLDTKFERDGLVLHDERANAYVRRIGLSLIPKGREGVVELSRASRPAAKRFRPPEWFDIRQHWIDFPY